jgi:hypothetical protein
MPPYRFADALPAIGLPELEAAAGLQDRVDTKYLMPVGALAELAERLRDTHAALEIDARRAFRYRTTYFDTPELRTFRDHLQQRRRRFKCRSREYVDSGLCTFEVKLKGPRGRTVKFRMAYDQALRDELSRPALAFLTDVLERSYGCSPGGDLQPALAVAYTRITLVGPGERLTCDLDLTFAAPDGTTGRLARDMAIVETKSARGGALADPALRALGVRPVRACSKYCLGIGLTRPAVTSNPLRPLLRRHFAASGFAPSANTRYGTWPLGQRSARS